MPHSFNFKISEGSLFRGFRPRWPTGSHSSYFHHASHKYNERQTTPAITSLHPRVNYFFSVKKLNIAGLAIIPLRTYSMTNSDFFSGFRKHRWRSGTKIAVFSHVPQDSFFAPSCHLNSQDPPSPPVAFRPNTPIPPDGQLQSLPCLPREQNTDERHSVRRLEGFKLEGTPGRTRGAA